MTATMKAGVAASVLLLATAAALYWFAQGSDADSYRRAVVDIRNIQQLASEWSVETARARTDPMGDYDALAAFIPQVAQQKDALLDTVRNTPAMPERLASDVYAFASALDAKEERIERFKTANSVVRNSARYLPHAATSIAQSPLDAALVGDVTALADGLDEYAAAPTDAAKGRLTAILHRLTDRQDALPEDQAGALANFLAHAKVLLDQQGPTERIFRQATSNEVSDLASELVADFDMQSELLEGRAELLKNGIWATGVTLLLVWLFVIAARSRPAPATEIQAPVAEVQAPAAEIQAPAADTAAVDATTATMETTSDAVHQASAAAMEKLLVSQRILTEAVSSRIAEALRTPDGDAKAMALEGGTTTEAETIAALAEGLAAASSPRDARYTLVDLKDCVKAALAATDADEHATVVSELGDAPQLFAAETEIGLMLEQVLGNAVNAIRDKGLGRDEGEIRIETANDGGEALVTIIDNGIGMSAADRERMFEPFAGTHADRQGVGLAITQHIVHKYGGRIAVASHEGGGSVFRITLPGMSE